METIKGIIISINEYKENQFILNILSEEALYSASTTSNKRKTNSSLQKFAFGEFILYKGPTKYFKIKDFNSDFLMSNVYSDFNRLIEIDFFNEILSKIDYENINIAKLYNLVLLTIKSIDNFSNNDRYITLYFFFHILKMLGLDPTYTKLYEKEKINLDCQDFTKSVDKQTFLILFRFFSKVLNDYLGVFLNSYYNFR